VTSQYHKESERGVIWNDSEIGLPWPIEPENAVISEKDMSMPKLAEIKKEMSKFFIY
jgi:dTDP-4-dehydrorhamnose 3,5-epimerase